MSSHSWRIALVSYEYPPFVYGGAGTWAEKISLELAQLGHEVHIICANSQYPSPKPEGIRIHRIPIGPIRYFQIPIYWFGTLLLFQKIERLVGGFDCIIGNGFSELLLVKRLSKATRITIMHQSAHEVIRAVNPSLKTRIRNFNNELGFAPIFDHFLIQRADGLVAVSKYVKNTLLRDYGKKIMNINVIYNGLEDCLIPLLEDERQQLRKNIGKGHLILFVGRPSDERKGFSYLLRAMPFILDHIDATLLVVGSGDISRYKQYAKDNNITTHVKFLGKVDKTSLCELYTISDLYVSVSKYESFGLTIVEAMSAECNVVAYDGGAIRETTHGSCAQIVSDLSSEKLASKIVSVLQGPDKEECGKTNRHFVYAHYSWKKTAEQLIRYLVKLKGDKHLC